MSSGRVIRDSPVECRVVRLFSGEVEAELYTSDLRGKLNRIVELSQPTNRTYIYGDLIHGFVRLKKTGEAICAIRIHLIDEVWQKVQWGSFKLKPEFILEICEPTDTEWRTLVDAFGALELRDYQEFVV